MPKTNTYVNREPTKDGKRSTNLYKENAELATLLCKIRGENLTVYVNRVIAKDLEKEFSVLKKTDDDQLML